MAAQRVKLVTQNLAALIGGLLIAALVLELGLRLLLYGGLAWEHSHLPPLVREPDPATGWHLAANQRAAERTLDYQSVVTTNADGLRGPRYPHEPDEGEFTIVLLGDSYMEATHVPEEQAFFRLLERELGEGFRVVNLGVGGFGTVQAWRQFEVRGKNYRPNLVLLGFYPENDVYNNSAELSRVMWGEDNPRYFSAPFVEVDDSGVLQVVPPQYARATAAHEEQRARYSPLLHWLDQFTHSTVEDVYKATLAKIRPKVNTPGQDPNIHLGVYIEDFNPSSNYEGTLDPAGYAKAWDAAWHYTEAVLGRLQDDVVSGGAQFALFSIPSKLQSEARYEKAVSKAYPDLQLDLDRPNARIAAMCEQRKIPFLDLLPDFRQEISDGKVLSHQRGSSHWNAEGHALAARQVATWLRDSGLLSKR
ncbi:MAG: hypothetical protein RLZZ303_999 [Candidatus Hydrogenedentota bacterium]|jgi:hypothetical protein